MQKKHFHLYVLSLEEGKHYVGITSQTPEKRFEEHKKSIRPAKWTKKYKPLRVLDSKDLGMMTLAEAEAYENKVVRKYMKEKGINNTRGGDLTDEDDYINRFGRLFLLEDWKTLTLVVFLLLALAYAVFAFYMNDTSQPRADSGASQTAAITTFEECVAAGYPVMESYPEQCAVPGGETFVNGSLDEQTLATPVMRSYENRTFGIEFSYSGEWTIQGNSENGQTYIYLRSPDYFDAPDVAYKSIEQGSEFVVYIRNVAPTDEQALQDYQQGLHSAFTITDASAIDIDGVEAARYTWAWEGPPRLSVAFIHGGKYVQVYYPHSQGEEKLKDLDLFDQLIESIALSEPAEEPIEEPEDEEPTLGEGQILINGEAVGLPVDKVSESCKPADESTFCTTFDGELRTRAYPVNSNTAWGQYGVTINEITRDVTLNGEETDDYIAFVVTANIISSPVGSATLYNSEFSIYNSEGSWRPAVELDGLAAKGGELTLHQDEFVKSGTVRQLVVFFEADNSESGLFSYAPDGYVWGKLEAEFREE